MAKKGSTAYVGINANTKGFEMGLRRLTRGFSNLNRGGGRLATGGLSRGFSGLGSLGVAGLGLAGIGFGATQFFRTFAKWSPEFNKAFVAITSSIRDTFRPQVEEFGRFLIANLPKIKETIGSIPGLFADAYEYWFRDFDLGKVLDDLLFVGDYWFKAGEELAQGFARSAISAAVGPEALERAGRGFTDAYAAGDLGTGYAARNTAGVLEALAAAMGFGPHGTTEGGGSL